MKSAEEQARELLPCEFPGEDDRALCAMCVKRPAVAAALEAKDAEMRGLKATLEQMKFVPAEIECQMAVDERDKLRAEAAALRKKVAELDKALAATEDQVYAERFRVAQCDREIAALEGKK